MAKNKLKRYSEFDNLPNTFDFNNRDLKGKWNTTVFKNDNPIVLELACGGGEYSIGLAEIDSSRNYIGIDINGARLWKGAKSSIEKGLGNVAFLRIQIEMICEYFDQNEVSEIWIIFPDPQPQISRVKKRLTSARFLDLYRHISVPKTSVNLKTDSPLFYNFTKEMISTQSLQIEEDISDIYKLNPVPNYLSIRTFYELKWLKESRVIRFIKFKLNK